MNSFKVISILLTIKGLSFENSNQLNDILLHNNRRIDKRLDDKSFGYNLFESNDSLSPNNNNNNKLKSNAFSDDSGHKTSLQSTERSGLVLYSHPSCHSDIESMCGRTTTALDNNLAVLECIQNQQKEEGIGLSSGCHHLIWSYKRNLTNDNHFSSVAKSVCKRLITANADCLESEHEKVLSPSANLLSCLIERLDPETDFECKSFLTKMETIIFSDYRLIHKFTQLCDEDIQTLKCGRLDINSEAVHTQGETIECLEKSSDKLSAQCQHQILRIAELQSDDFHLDRSLYFACREDRERFCHRIQSGEGRVYRCLMRHKLERDLSRKCREKLFQREMLSIQDYKVAKGLAKACKQDIRRYHCREDTSDQKEIRLAQILLCLENSLSKSLEIDSECRSEMLSHRRSLLENYNLTPDLVSVCDSDIQKFCSRLETGGRTVHCLMKYSKVRRRGAKKGQISQQCRRALEDLLKEANIGEDWRVDPILQESCQSSVDTLCQHIEPGEGRVMSCLMDGIDSKDMSEDCRQNLLQIQYFIVRDFQLDSPLYRSCHTDAVKYCHAKNDWFDKPEHMDPERGPSVLSCLYRYAYHPNERVRLNRQCIYDIRRVMKLRAQSVDLMPDIEEPCLQDLASHCNGQSDGQKEEDVMKRGFEMECLQQNYQKLDTKCQTAIGNFTEEESEHLELNYPLIKACALAIKEVCTDLMDRDIDEGDLMECLALNKNKPAMNRHPKCRVAIEHFQLLALKDFRFSFKFKESCKSDVLNYCRTTVRTKYDVIACLSGIVFNDTQSGRRKPRISPDCQNQLRVELLERNENIKLDPILDNACEYDRNEFCADVSPGGSQVIECLKTNIHKLRKSCQRVLFKRQRIEMTDNSIDYSLMTNCKTAITKFCSTDELKDVLFCLRDHRDNIAMDQRCRSLVIKRLAQQNTDYRLNPRLKSACQRDVPKFCSQIIDKHRNDDQLEGEVIGCLKKQYVLNKLSQMCEIEVVNVIREVAQNVELDPILYKSCQNEIKTKCWKDFDVEECLKTLFQNKQIEDQSCKRQMARLINEAKADIQSDPLLYKVCVQDLKHYCSDIPAGHGRQLSCLMAEHESSSKLSPECQTMLAKRVEMFEYAAQVAPAESVAQVLKLVSSSPQKNYFLFVFLCCVSVVFGGGLLCGRFTKRITNNDKIK